MSKNLIIIGAGKHARVLLDILLEQDIHVIGLTDKVMQKNTIIYGIPVLGDDNEILKYSPESVSLVNGIGSDHDLTLREKVYNYFKSKGYNFSTVIHPSAIISKRAILHEGCQILAGTIINTEAEIGEDSIINTKVSVDHDCKISSNVHIAPGSVLSGNVIVGNSTHIGTGSSIIQGITIGSNVLIGAGSLVIRNVDNNSKLYGVPAKIVNFNLNSI